MEEEFWAWIDTETTGLRKDRSQLCEIAIIITDQHLKELGFFHRVIDAREGYWHPEALMMHNQNGLYSEMYSDGVLRGKNKYDDLAVEISNCLNGYVHYKPESTLFTLAGSSVHFDRAILENHFGQDWVDSWFHHIHIDVSVISKEKRTIFGKEYFDDLDLPVSDHRAMSDLRRSISLLKYCRAKKYEKDDK